MYRVQWGIEFLLTMVILSYTQSTVYLLEIKKDVWGNVAIRETMSIPTIQGKDWVDAIRKTIRIENEKIIFVVPEEEAYIQRILLPENMDEDAVTKYVEQETQTTIPIPMPKRLYEVGQISEKELFYITTKKKTMIDYLEKVETLDSHVVFALPQSMGIYEIIKHTIKEGTIAVYIHKEKDKIMVSGIDAHGPLFSTPLKANDQTNTETIRTLLKTTERQHNKTVSRAFSNTDDHSIALDIPFHDMGVLIDNAIISNKISVTPSIQLDASFATHVGLALMHMHGNSINLVNPMNMAILIEEVDAQDKKETHLEQSDEDRANSTHTKIENSFKAKGSPSIDIREHISWKMVVGIALSIITVAGVLVAGNQYMIAKQQAEEVEQKRIPTEQPKTSPTPTLKRTDIAMQVLNGTGQAGVASKAKEYLEEQGYEDIDTDNADRFEYQETVILIKEDVDDYRKLIIQDLEEQYIISDNEETLDDGAEYDAVIIIGEERGSGIDTTDDGAESIEETESTTNVGERTDETTGDADVATEE